jgi:hypothetical protein
MSATSPELIAGRSDPRHATDLRVALRRLFVSRQFWQAFGRVVGIFAALLLWLVIVGVFDHFRPLARATRLVLVLPALIGGLAGIGPSIWLAVRRRSLSQIARVVERTGRLDGNALVTFAENVDQPPANFAIPSYMRSQLDGQARRDFQAIDVRRVAPRENALRAAAALVCVVFVLVVLGIVAPKGFAREARRILWLDADDASVKNSAGNVGANLESGAISIESFRVRVTPPSYSGLSVEEATGDGPVRALAGSQIEIFVSTRGRFDSAVLNFAGASNQMRSTGDGDYSGSFVANASGAFEMRIDADNGRAPSPVVRAVEVYPDAPPEARIAAPAGDQLLRAVPAAPVDVRWTARDDLGLADVVLKYIRSRGEGDAAQFVNGTVALGNVNRGSARDWQGGAALDLNRIGMQAGDTLVYWIEARDRNPSSNNLGRSASLAIAISAPEPVKLNLGDLGPTEIGRFLLSQRMIIINTEKLHRERNKISRDEFMKRAQYIAADQREFKNSFNGFISTEGGGEEPGGTHGSEGANQACTDPAEIDARVQESEAERTGVHMHGIPEPPSGAASNVRDMIYAIRAMWDAEEALSLGETAKALVHENEALTRLKRAQSAVRYVPPIVARSKPIDLKRRYAGELNEIKTRLEKLSRRGDVKNAVPLRAALGDAYAALGELQTTLDVPVTARASAVARARDKSRAAADVLTSVGGDHASTVAEAIGQLRIVETELSKIELGGSSEQYSSALSKPLSLLTQAAANLFAIAEANTRATGGDSNIFLPADDARSSEYFRRLGR